MSTPTIETEVGQEPMPRSIYLDPEVHRLPKLCAGHQQLRSSEAPKTAEELPTRCSVVLVGGRGEIAPKGCPKGGAGWKGCFFAFVK